MPQLFKIVILGQGAARAVTIQAMKGYTAWIGAVEQLCKSDTVTKLLNFCVIFVSVLVEPSQQLVAAQMARCPRHQAEGSPHTDAH